MNEGGIIGKQNITTATSASGMWSGNQVFLRNTVSGEWPSFNAPDAVTYNVIGGGGGGGNGDYQSGGAGSVLVQGNYAPLAGVVYTVTVGAGGAREGNGGTSSLIGTGLSASSTGGNGSSGTNQDSGGSNATYAGGAGGAFAAGGGAGAGGNGGACTSFNGGDGGPGVTFIHPTGLTVGGGGGGGGYSSGGTAVDGGGHGRQGGGDSAPANRGGGGGGAGTGQNGGTGGSGRVVLRYADTYLPATATTGSPTVTVANGYRYYDFTSSGSITF